jgi:hypothetical protein
LGTTPAPVR